MRTRAVAVLRRPTASIYCAMQILLEFQRLGLLRLVRVFAARVNSQFLDLSAPQLGLGQHTLDRGQKYTVGKTVELLAHCAALQPTRIARVAIIADCVQLVTR